MSRFERKDAGDAWEIKRLPRPFSVQAAVGEPGTFSGHGAVFDVPHPTSSWMLDTDWQDMIAAGAFADTLAAHAKRGVMPAMLYMHQRGNVIGAWDAMVEDQNGLKVSGRVSMDAKAPNGARIYDLMKMGALNALSIGFRVLKSELDEKAKVRTITAVELGETSVVDIPGGPEARISDVKARDGVPTERIAENALREAGYSRREAKAILAGGLKALRDAGDEQEPRDAAKPEEKSEDYSVLISRIRGMYRP